MSPAELHAALTSKQNCYLTKNKPIKKKKKKEEKKTRQKSTPVHFRSVFSLKKKTKEKNKKKKPKGF